MRIAYTGTSGLLELYACTDAFDTGNHLDMSV